MAEEEMVTITKKKYDELVHDAHFLECLRAAGVDNWDGYDNAIDILEEQDEKE